MFIATDLHGHTLFSDGRATPEEYVTFRRDLGMQVIAIADHDIFAASRRGFAAASEFGMTFVAAAEITSFLHFGTDEAEQFHVLAYFPSSVFQPGRLEATFLYRRGLTVQARWRDFVLSWIAGLPVEEREAIDPSGELERLSPDAFPGLQSMINRVVERRRDLFHPFRLHHVSFWDDRELFAWTPEEAIEAIRGDGALDVVAHSARYGDRVRTRQVLDYAQGVEVYTSRHKAEIAEELRAYAEGHKKHWTASSDDHQNARYIRPASGTPVRTVARILDPEAYLRSIAAA